MALKLMFNAAHAEAADLAFSGRHCQKETAAALAAAAA